MSTIAGAWCVDGRAMLEKDSPRKRRAPGAVPVIRDAAKWSVAL